MLVYVLIVSEPNFYSYDRHVMGVDLFHVACVGQTVIVIVMFLWQGVDQFYSKEDIDLFVDNVDSDVWKAISLL